MRHEKYLRHFAEIIYGSNSMGYMKTKENQPQFRKLLLYPDELRGRCLVYSPVKVIFQELIYQGIWFEFVPVF